MTKRILLLFFVLAAFLLPVTAATKSHRHKHVAAHSRKAKSVRKATRHRTKSAAAKEARRAIPRRSPPGEGSSSAEKIEILKL